ncbi:DUF2244 domain-containing protein [Ideonella sp. BN130291]|uniref:DUF2244 domain-containing protein n=1 Tax=Ideonella sp. BN130291 TaxID=3112940 RepID=UPI002E255907|nr:DUF2244 domain-containing protein [Ideonella sp. BN130291]
MTATLAPSPWPAPTPAASPCSPWRFARELHTPSGVVLLWVLRRNCSLSPRQLLRAVLAVSAAALAVALFFWWRGATLVLPFAGLEVLGLVGVVLLYGRHATDHETLTLSNGELQVAHQCGSRVDRTAFRAACVRVEPRAGDASLVELSGQGRRAHVGRYVLPHCRPALAQELRRALRGTGAAAAKESELELK